MYYDTYRGKRSKRGRRRERRSCTSWLLRGLMKLVGFALLLALLAAGLLYALPAGFLNVEPADVELSLTDGLPGSRVNVLLLGLDYLDDGRQRSDGIMVASVGYDGLRLASLMRDTMVEIPGHGRGKLNSAYAIGGPELAMCTVNETFKLNITNYVAVDLKTLVDLVDAVGGVVVNLEEKELENLNHYAWDTFKKISAQDAARYAHYADSQPVTQTGDVLLNGLFATAYTRIRYVDSDYMRAARQREVISGALKRLREGFYNPMNYLRLYEVYKNSVKTNLSLPEVISLGEKVLVSGKMETHRAPANEHIQDSGSAILIIDPEANVRALYNFLYN